MFVLRQKNSFQLICRFSNESFCMLPYYFSDSSIWSCVSEQLLSYKSSNKCGSCRTDTEDWKPGRVISRIPEFLNICGISLGEYSIIRNPRTSAEPNYCDELMKDRDFVFTL